jgi:RhoGEF domain/SOS1/NGEF-like PH domain/FYVE zinc finger
MSAQRPGPGPVEELVNVRGVALLRSQDGLRDLCDRCGDESEAAVDCLECLVQFCSECSRDVHARGKWQSHRILPIASDDPAQAVSLARHISIRMSSAQAQAAIAGAPPDSLPMLGTIPEPASAASPLQGAPAGIAPIPSAGGVSASPAALSYTTQPPPAAAAAQQDGADDDIYLPLSTITRPPGAGGAAGVSAATSGGSTGGGEGGADASHAAAMRRSVLAEILQTEREYVKDLDTFARVYVATIVAGRFNSLVGSKHDRTFDIRVVFSTMDLIRQHNSELLAELEQFGDDQVGRVFAQKLDNFTLYSVYCNNQAEVMARIGRASEKDSAFAKFLEDAKMDPDTRGLSFEDFFIKPFQRILKYPLLLKELIKYTPESHPDYESIAAAIDKIQEEVNLINQNKADQDNLRTVRDLMGRIEGLDKKIVLMEMRFIKQGTMMKISGDNRQEREFFLFADQLLYCKKSATSSNKWVFRGCIALEHLIVEDLEDTDKLRHALQLTRANENLTYIVYVDSQKDKLSWLRELESAKERADTSNTRLHGARPIWRPDSTATHCFGCGGKFTFRNRRHHCRRCGHIFCGLCCSNFVEFPDGEFVWRNFFFLLVPPPPPPDRSHLSFSPFFFLLLPLFLKSSAMMGSAVRALRV